MTKKDLAHVLHYDAACVFGQPTVIILNRDPRIDNDFLLSMSALQGTSHRLTVSYRPRGNGQAEAYNKEIFTKLKMFCLDPTRRVDWDQSVQQCTFAYDTSVHTAHGLTPFFLVREFHPSTLFSL
jgi:hypothetical protein